MADIKVRIGQQNSVKVLSTISGTNFIALNELTDVNVSNGLSNGMVLVYNASTNKWDATLDLTPGDVQQNLNINGGAF